MNLEYTVNINPDLMPRIRPSIPSRRRRRKPVNEDEGDKDKPLPEKPKTPYSPPSYDPRFRRTPTPNLPGIRKPGTGTGMYVIASCINYH